MSIEVVYFSKTGHSRKIAEAVAAELGVTAQDIKGSPMLEDANPLFLITGMYASKSDPEVLKFIERLDPQAVSRVCLITSSLSKMAPEDIPQALRSRGIPVHPEVYRCRGSFLFFGLGHPSASELAGAAAFARAVVGNLN